MPEFPWAAFLEAVKTKNQNQQQMMDQFGGAIANTGQNVGVGLEKQKRAKQLKAFFESQSQPVPRGVSAQGSDNLPAASYDPNSGSVTPLTKPNPNAPLIQGAQSLPSDLQQAVVQGMAARTPESPYQQAELGLKKQQLALDAKKAAMQDKIEQTRLLESQGYHAESLALRAQIAQDRKDLLGLIFNARQQQGADTKNMGLGGFFRGMFGGGVTPSKVPTGGTDRDTVRKNLGLQ